MDRLVEYAMSFVGQPYIWGGTSPGGWDCSGFVQEILASVGMDKPGRQNSHHLYLEFKETGGQLRKAGSLAFFGTPERIIHVGFMIDGHRMVEAGGGDSGTTTVALAWRANAFVKVRPVVYRRDLVAIYAPNYPAWVVAAGVSGSA